MSARLTIGLILSLAFSCVAPGRARTQASLSLADDVVVSKLPTASLTESAVVLPGTRSGDARTLITGSQSNPGPHLVDTDRSAQRIEDLSSLPSLMQDWEMARTEAMPEVVSAPLLDVVHIDTSRWSLDYVAVTRKEDWVEENAPVLRPHPLEPDMLQVRWSLGMGGGTSITGSVTAAREFDKHLEDNLMDPGFMWVGVGLRHSF
ncbi:MAG: hypothetical protein ACI841_001174 [Planctomycetota bacterium]|jgi:hypothetical protein